MLKETLSVDHFVAAQVTPPQSWPWGWEGGENSKARNRKKLRFTKSEFLSSQKRE